MQFLTWYPGFRSSSEVTKLQVHIVRAAPKKKARDSTVFIPRKANGYKGFCIQLSKLYAKYSSIIWLAVYPSIHQKLHAPRTVFILDPFGSVPQNGGQQGYLLTSFGHQDTRRNHRHNDTPGPLRRKLPHSNIHPEQHPKLRINRVVWELLGRSILEWMILNGIWECLTIVTRNIWAFCFF